MGMPWEGEARELLEAAVRRHGGWDAWEKLQAVSLRPKSVTGLLPGIKGVGRTFPVPARIEIRPHQRAATFFDYPRPGWRGDYTDGKLAITDDRGTAIESTPDPRPTFRGLRKLRRWTPADALYFFGYALTHYYSLPFTLVEGRPLALRWAWYERRRLRGIEVELPAALHTHCRRQTFYFEEDGLLRRHDYVAEIVGWWARGAHLWSDFVTAGGIEIAQRRRVVGRLGRRATSFTVLSAELAVER